MDNNVYMNGGRRVIGPADGGNPRGFAQNNQYNGAPQKSDFVAIWNTGYGAGVPLTIQQTVYSTPEQGQSFPVARRHVAQFLRLHGQPDPKTKRRKLATRRPGSAAPAPKFEVPAGFKLVPVEAEPEIPEVNEDLVEALFALEQEDELSGVLEDVEGVLNG